MRQRTRDFCAALDKCVELARAGKHGQALQLHEQVCAARRSGAEIAPILRCFESTGSAYDKFWPSRRVEKTPQYRVDDLLRALMGNGNGH
jgi:hypothetical protein